MITSPSASECMIWGLLNGWKDDERRTSVRWVGSCYYGVDLDQGLGLADEFPVRTVGASGGWDSLYTPRVLLRVGSYGVLRGQAGKLGACWVVRRLSTEVIDRDRDTGERLLG